MCAPMKICSPTQTSAAYASVTCIRLQEATYATYVARLRTRRGATFLTFDTLAAYFTLPAMRAAEEIGISSRTLIRVCRSLGIRRWPFLSIRSENSVARIRHEAIGTLTRHLNKSGARVPPAGSVLYPQAHRHNRRSPASSLMRGTSLAMPLSMAGNAATGLDTADVVAHVQSAFSANSGHDLRTDALFRNPAEHQSANNANTHQHPTPLPGYQVRVMSMQDILGASLATA